MPHVPSLDLRRRRRLRRLLLSMPVLAAGCGSGGSDGSRSGMQSAAAAPAPAPAPESGSGSGSGSAPGSEAPGSEPEAGPAGRTLKAGPSDYLAVLRTLQPGDTLELAAGVYHDPANVPGLPIFNLAGTPAQRITITGPQAGDRPLLIGRATHNTIRLANARYITIRNLDIDGRDLGGAGVAVQGPAHDITIENLTIVGTGGNQQQVGISTVGYPTWNWVIRRNTIIGAGTGIYLGDSDGSSPFVAGVIENNLIRDPIGYCMQVKHQNPRPELDGMPTGRSVTRIRHNVFAKSANSSTGSMARPNLLVGHFPLSGPGTDDVYEIYGNFFWQNPTEALFQGEGNIAFYSNLLVNDSGSALNVQRHNDVPRMIRICGNTVIASASGIRITGADPTYGQRVWCNAVFAATPLSGGAQHDNVVDAHAAAAAYLKAPAAALGGFDAYPLPGALRQAAVDLSELAPFTAFDRDFDGVVRDPTLRGAYGSDTRSGNWTPVLSAKP